MKKEFKQDEIALYRGERVRVLMHAGDWVNIWIPSRQEEIAVKTERLEKIALKLQVLSG